MITLPPLRLHSSTRNGHLGGGVGSGSVRSTVGRLTHHHGVNGFSNENSDNNAAGYSTAAVERMRMAEDRWGFLCKIYFVKCHKNYSK